MSPPLFVARAYKFRERVNKIVQAECNRQKRIAPSYADRIEIVQRKNILFRFSTQCLGSYCYRRDAKGTIDVATVQITMSADLGGQRLPSTRNPKHPPSRDITRGESRKPP